MRTLTSRALVVDLHCHLLPGIDDGAPEIGASIAMARAAVAGGVETIVATPHVSPRYPNDPATLARRCEPPYTGAAPFIDRMVDELHSKGFGIVLAHPERISAFQRNIEMLESLVDHGALCSVTAGSVSGQFGARVKRFTLELFARGLVHNLTSDAHDAEHRSPALRPLLDKAVAELPALEHALGWLTGEVPSAILAGEQVQGSPPAIASKGGLRGRVRRG